MKLAAADFDVEVRAGTVADVPLLLSFFREMAAFERLDVEATEQSLQESLFGARPAAETLLAFVDGTPAAYAVYYFTFSTMVGKRGLWLEDVFVRPEFRGKGIGKAFMTYLAGIALDQNCGRFEWSVLDWNSAAIDFYRGLGATFLDDWRICRLDKERLTRVADGARVDHRG